MNKYMPRAALLLSIVLMCCIPEFCFAHREDYIDETLVFLTLEKRAFEPEYWLDAGRETDARHNLTRHSIAAEYGITEHFMMDGRASVRRDPGEAGRFESARFEMRRRFGDEGDRPIDFAVSAEANVERDLAGDDHYGFEPRLIFSKDFARMNLTANTAFEIPLSKGTGSFGPAFGVRYDASEGFRFGGEVKYDTESSGGSAIPQVWIGVVQWLTLKLGASQGFAHNHENFLRAALEAEF